MNSQKTIATTTLKSILLFAVLLQQACVDKAERLKGHWHMKEPYNLTLDISDSMIVVNKYSLLEDSYKFPLRDSSDGRITLPIPCGCGDAMLPVIKNVKIEGDSLIYDDKKTIDHCYAFSPIKFVKGDSENCKWSHAFGGTTTLIKVSNFSHCRFAPY